MPKAKRKGVVVLHGPNLNALGRREKHVYGAATLADIDATIRTAASQLGLHAQIFQYSSEGELIDAIHLASERGDAIIINAGAYSHYSYAIRDALSAAAVPKVEVHLSNVYAREAFRHDCVIAAAVDGCILGFGAQSYVLGMRAVSSMLDGPPVS
ncbi:MAG: type II 3-dehydroquinate dehydratase [Candidatus Eremiobacteraeota bacterium]|nr:type II 3-dehydroquinate dehydratase [Candidatus Eremiobacteraeota bacterium]MBC5827849.1 type II 3-dehydroquinate dehydratase [Candidatus Eremiobacteraeota bacterium]